MTIELLILFMISEGKSHNSYHGNGYDIKVINMSAGYIQDR